MLPVELCEPSCKYIKRDIINGKKQPNMCQHFCHLNAFVDLSEYTT